MTRKYHKVCLFVHLCTVGLIASSCNFTDRSAGAVITDSNVQASDLQKAVTYSHSRYDNGDSTVTYQPRLVELSTRRVDSVKVVINKLKEVNVFDFGAKGNGLADDSQALSQAVAFIQKDQSNEQCVLIIPAGYEFAVRVDLKVNGLHVRGGGTIVPITGKSDYALILTGDNNVIEDVNFYEKTAVRNLLTINGSDNHVYKCNFDGPTRSNSSSVIYSDRMLYVANDEGTNNVISQCKVNNGRIGIGLSGSYKLVDSEISNCIMGVWARSSTRDSEISRNVIRDNNINNKSGADGILAHRNVSKLHIHHNKISNSGEHGIYFQGDNSVIEYNEVYNSHGSGIKLASYTTSLYNYSNNAKDYIGEGVTIRHNICFNNSVGKNSSTGAGIYLQAPLRNITVNENTCYDNHYGIRSTSVSRLKPEELATRAVLKDITFLGNNVVGNKAESLFIEGETGIAIIDNVADDVLTTSKSSTHRLESPIIRGNNIRGRLHVNRVADGVIEDNIINSLNFNPNSIRSNHKLSNNEVQTTNMK